MLARILIHFVSLAHTMTRMFYGTQSVEKTRIAWEVVNIFAEANGQSFRAVIQHVKHITQNPRTEKKHFQSRNTRADMIMERLYHLRVVTNRWTEIISSV